MHHKPCIGVTIIHNLVDFRVVLCIHLLYANGIFCDGPARLQVKWLISRGFYTWSFGHYQLELSNSFPTCSFSILFIFSLGHYQLEGSNSFLNVNFNSNSSSNFTENILLCFSCPLSFVCKNVIIVVSLIMKSLIASEN